MLWIRAIGTSACFVHFQNLTGLSKVLKLFVAATQKLQSSCNSAVKWTGTLYYDWCFCLAVTFILKQTHISSGKFITLPPTFLQELIIEVIRHAAQHFVGYGLNLNVSQACNKMEVCKCLPHNSKHWTNIMHNVYWDGQCYPHFYKSYHIMYTSTRVQAKLWAKCAHTCIYTHMHACTCARAHTHTHTHTQHRLIVVKDSAA